MSQKIKMYNKYTVYIYLGYNLFNVYIRKLVSAASFHLHKPIHSSKANTVAENLFILRFLVLPHLHRERSSRLLRVRGLLERSWKWCDRDFLAFLDAVKREIYLKHLVLINI